MVNNPMTVIFPANGVNEKRRKTFFICSSVYKIVTTAADPIPNYRATYSEVTAVFTFASRDWSIKELRPRLYSANHR